ncbi:MAG: SIMPL domain-containing protein [Solirubrobacterales bacterium]
MNPLRCAALVGLAIALLLPASATALDRTVTVKGTATEKVVNDAASLSFSVSKERRTRGAALRAASLRLREVIAAVQTVPGVGPGDVTTGRVFVRETLRGKKTIFRASQGIAVILHQADKAGELINAAINAGATGANGPNFYPSDPDLAYNKALLTAFDRAKAKAAALATRAGATLGPAITIEEGTEIVPDEPAPVTTAKSGPRGGENAPPVKAGTSTVTATVRVVFELQ